MGQARSSKHHSVDIIIPNTVVATTTNQTLVAGFTSHNHLEAFWDLMGLESTGGCQVVIHPTTASSCLSTATFGFGRTACAGGRRHRQRRQRNDQRRDHLGMNQHWWEKHHVKSVDSGQEHLTRSHWLFTLGVGNILLGTLLAFLTYCCLAVSSFQQSEGPSKPRQAQFPCVMPCHAA